MSLQDAQPPALVQPAPVTGPVSLALPNGLRVAWYGDHQRPTFRMRLVCRPDFRAVQGDQSAAIHLLAMLLKEEALGTAPKGSLALPARIQGVWTGVALELDLEGVTADFEQTLMRLGAWLRSPALASESLERLRATYRILPTPVLERLVADMQIEAHSHGTSLVPIPTEAQLDRIKLEHIRALHAATLSAACMEVTGVGDVDLQQVNLLMTRYLGVLPGGAAPPPPPSRTIQGVSWRCDAPEGLPAFHLGLRLWGPNGEGAAPGHLLPFLMERRPEAPWHVDPQAGFLRLTVTGKRPETYPAELDGWLEQQGSRALTEADLQQARTAWHQWRRAMALHPGERLAWLASGGCADLFAQRVEAVTLAQVQAAWKTALQKSGRQTLLVGQDARFLSAFTAAGWLPPEQVKVRR